MQLQNFYILNSKGYTYVQVSYCEEVFCVHKPSFLMPSHILWLINFMAILNFVSFITNI